MTAFKKLVSILAGVGLGKSVIRMTKRSAEISQLLHNLVANSVIHLAGYVSKDTR